MLEEHDAEVAFQQAVIGMVFESVWEMIPAGGALATGAKEFLKLGLSKMLQGAAASDEPTVQAETINTEFVQTVNGLRPRRSHRRQPTPTVRSTASRRFDADVSGERERPGSSHLTIGHVRTCSNTCTRRWAGSRRWEGIESEDQLALLRDQHCELGQGYLFARPLTKADAELLLPEMSWVRS